MIMAPDVRGRHDCRVSFDGGERRSFVASCTATHPHTRVRQTGSNRVRLLMIVAMSAMGMVGMPLIVVPFFGL